MSQSNASRPAAPRQAVNAVILFHERDRTILDALESHLAPLCRRHVLEIWHRGKILPGDHQETVIQRKLGRANLILLLLSADFNAAYDDDFLAKIRGWRDGRTRLVPVLARPCNWTDLPFSGLRPIPSDEIPLVMDSALSESRLHVTVTEIRDLVEDIAASIVDSSTPQVDLSIIALLANMERERYLLERANSARSPAAEGPTAASDSPSTAPDVTPRRPVRMTGILRAIADSDVGTGTTGSDLSRVPAHVSSLSLPDSPRDEVATRLVQLTPTFLKLPAWFAYVAAAMALWNVTVSVALLSVLLRAGNADHTASGPVHTSVPTEIGSTSSVKSSSSTGSPPTATSAQDTLATLAVPPPKMNVVLIDSEPSGATLTVGFSKIQLPDNIEVEEGKTVTVRVKKAGYEPVEVEIDGKHPKERIKLWPIR